MGQTTIEWTDLTVNPIRARLNGATGHHCVKLSAGCAHCYSSRMQARFGMPPFEADKRRDVEVFFDKKPIRALLTRRKPAKVFWCDMTDLFGEWVPDEWIDRCFAVMSLTPRLTHQVLTKRPERMRAYVTSRPALDPGHVSIWTEQGCQEVNGISEGFKYRVPWPLPNVMLGVSVENQETADARIPLLLQTPAATRFVSAEPLLGPIDLGYTMTRAYREAGGQPAFQWAIVGGESSPHARPCNVEWVRSLLGQCKVAGVPAFVKQLGTHVVDRNDAGFEGDGPDGCWPMDTEAECLTGQGWQGDPVRVRLRSRKGADPSEWPTDLRVRQWPEGSGG